ncbi:uncharacterized protein [Anoplolepis gracilipes]|uniref:uncharacterized protein n=1 Tax=Anoplolepis gracilipes TaxID=354296 RepID=UPI003BA1C14A
MAESAHWITDYYIFEDKNAKCSICSKIYEIFKTIEPFKKHIITQHNEDYRNIVEQEGNPNWLWNTIFITELQNIKCNDYRYMCDYRYMIHEELQFLIYHLTEEHQINNSKKLRIHGWIHCYIEQIAPQKQKCMLCNHTYNPSNCYNLQKHLFDVHKLIRPDKFDTTKKIASVASARKSVADSNYETTDDERLGRGERPHVPFDRFDEEELDCQSQRKYIKRKQISEKTVQTTLPSCSLNLDFINKESNILKVNNVSRCNENITSSEKENDSLITLDEENDSNSLHNMPVTVQENIPFENLDITNIKDSIQEMLLMQAATNIGIKNIQNRLLKIETAIKNQALSLNKINDDLIREQHQQ